MAKRGRKSKITAAIFDEIFRKMCLGVPLNKILRNKEMPSRSAFYMWLKVQTKEILDMYALARECQVDYWVDECIEISDDGSNDTYEDEDGKERTDHDVVHRSRLRVDTRKWIACKLNRKKYGDAQEEPSEARKPENITIVINPKPEDD